MEFVETSIFEKVSKTFLSEDELHQLQMTLSIYPTIGVIIQGASGLRKLRWMSSGKGKRSGLRIIYYLVTQEHKIFLLYVYKKSKQENLHSDYLRYLRSLVGGIQYE